MQDSDYDRDFDFNEENYNGIQPTGVFTPDPLSAKKVADIKKKIETPRKSIQEIIDSGELNSSDDVLENHYLISAGSFYTKPFNTALGEENEVLPLLWLLDEHSNPELHYAWFHIAHGSYGTASYAIKI